MSAQSAIVRCCSLLISNFAWPLIIHSLIQYTNFGLLLAASYASLHLCSSSLCRQDSSAGRSPTWVWCGGHARYGLSYYCLTALHLLACLLHAVSLLLTNPNSLWLTNVHKWKLQPVDRHWDIWLLLQSNKKNTACKTISNHQEFQTTSASKLSGITCCLDDGFLSRFGFSAHPEEVCHYGLDAYRCDHRLVWSQEWFMSEVWCSAISHLSLLTAWFFWLIFFC